MTIFQLSSRAIAPHHYEEWTVDSNVHPDIVRLNVRSISDVEIDPLAQEVTTPIADLLNWQFVRFGHQVKREIRGWWVNGVDPLDDWKDMEWGRFKPDQDTPIIDRQKNKPAKYLSPKGVQSRATFLKMSWRVGFRVANRYGLGDEYEQRFLQAYRTGEGRSSTQASEANHGRRDELSAGGDSRDLALAIRISKRTKGASDIAADHLKAEDTGFWQWLWGATRIPITLTEGEKKAGSLLTQGYPAIALPGITTGVRTKGGSIAAHLIPELVHFAQPEREIYICFDYETKPTTIKKIEKEIVKLKAQFVAAECKTKIISLPGPQKGVDDFIVARGTEALDQCYAKAATFEQWQAERYSRLSQPADLELNQRYLGSLPIPADEKLILLKSPKGTGKTESFIEIANEAAQEGIRVLLLTHRVQLGQAICDRIGLPYVSELKTSEEGSLLGYGVCIDSLYPESQARFNAEHWHDAIVIIDEVEQFIWHLLESTTEVSNRRIPILNQLRQLLINVLESDRGKIILSDADLSDLSLEFVHKLIGQHHKPFTVINHYKPENPWQINHYDDRSPERLAAALSQHIEAGGIPFILTQSQQAKSKWSTTTLEGWINRSYPDKRVLRIDSQTVADPSHPAYLCTGKLNEIVKGYDVVIASPVIETGVSIDVKGHFTSVWGIFGGVTPENSARQALARIREAVPRHIYVARYSPNGVANRSTSMGAIAKAEHDTARMTQKLVQVVHYDEETAIAYDGAFWTWAKMAARINAGMVRYRDCVLAGLQAEGHVITNVGPETAANPLVIETIQTVRTEQHEAQCEAIAVADEITPKQYEELKGKKAKTQKQRYEERKHAIASRYQIDVTPDLVAKDDDGWYPKLRLFYFLSIGNQFLKERDRQSLENITQTSGSWLPTLNRSQYSVKIAVLEALGVKRLLDPDLEFAGGVKREGYSSAHPVLLDIQERALKYGQVIKNVLGISISDKYSPVQIAQALLGKLGIKLHCCGQVGGTGHRERIYRYSPPKDGRDEILNGWYTRDDATRTNSEMHTPGIDNNYPAERRAS